MTPRQFAARLEKLADAQEDLVEELAEKALQIVEEGFELHRDPKNTSWRPRKRTPKPFYPIHEESLSLEHSFRILGVNKNGFGIGSDCDYAAVRNFGVEGQAWPRARKMLPDNGQPLPERFAAPMQEVARAFIRKRLK